MSDQILNQWAILDDVGVIEQGTEEEIRAKWNPEPVHVCYKGGYTEIARRAT